MITIAILAKNSSTTLPLYLYCLENQTFPKNKTNLYIRTNDNTDNTIDILKEYIKKHNGEYNDIYYDDSSINEELKKMDNHEWNSFRFKILGKIRQESIDYAIKMNSWYFVADCDNFISPTTIESLMNFNLPVVAPLLYSDNYYSNYHSNIDENGYLKETDFYYQLLNRDIKGLIQVPVVHCTYLIRPDILPSVSYDDNSYRYEYVIFSDVLRKANIPQYISNIDPYYGYIVFWQKESDIFIHPKLEIFLNNSFNYCKIINLINKTN
jgi:hypothetical protein